MGSNCCKGDAAGGPLRSNSSIYSRSRAGASLDDRFAASDDVGGVRLTVSAARTGDSGVYTLQASNAAGTDAARVRLEVAADETPTGDDPPNFLRRLQDLTVKVGTRTRFLVEILSSTECKVTWYRNERRLMEAERIALVRDGHFWCADVSAVSVDDAGRWTCTAENAGGRASCSAHLNVLVPKAYKRPEFVEELRALLTEQGTVSLECKVVGVPTPILRWFKDSREIKAGDVFALTANAEDPTSLGTYTCEAVNCMGRAYSSSKVHVVGRGSREGSAKPTSATPEPPPIFTKELEPRAVRICEPLALSCQLVVPPWPRSVVWYNKDGKLDTADRYHILEDGVGGYLVEIPSAEWCDEGEWKCVATSPGGRVGISTTYVTMEVPKNYRKPRFMENLQAVLTEEGLVSFECKVVGFPTPVLSWFKDGQELKPGDVYQLTGTNSLGSYCCIARNCMGHASSSAELTVEDIQNQLNEEEKLQLFSKNQAPKFVQGLKSVEAKIDEPFRFTIKVQIPPEPSVLWYRDDQPIDESTRCHLGKEDKGLFSLDIQNLEFLDQAEWKCVAMNDFGHSVTSCFLKLLIPRHYKKPRFLENLQAILSDEGAVNLECKVIGVPQPILKWYKDGDELKPGDIHRIISGQDGTCCLGTYTCEARNCMGIAASSASLLGFDDSMKAKTKKPEEPALQRNLSLSTIHEERTSQMYDTPVGDITLDDKGEISFSFDGKSVSVSLYETPDLTEEEALQIVEMYADQLSENVTEHNVVELPPLRFVKETSTSGNLLMEAIIIDVSPDYFVSPEEDLRTEADVEDISIADENAVPQLSLDTDLGGEDYLEKTMALLSDERSDIPKKLTRKKSDSIKSGEDFFSLSREQSLSEDKRDDDTQVSESFASARSSTKVKSKSLKPSDEEAKESSDLTKTILVKEEVQKGAIEAEQSPVIKPKRERRSSRGSRRSSSGSEKSLSFRSRSKEPQIKPESDPLVPLDPISTAKVSITDDEFKSKMTNISMTLSKVINDVQIIERDIILKSELMSSAATASRSLEIISSLITPLSEIHSIADAAKESPVQAKELGSTLFNSVPQSLKALQQSLTIIEKCIGVESDSRTLVKKTCIAFIQSCGKDMQMLMTELSSLISKDYLLTDDKTLTEIDLLSKEITTVLKYSAETVQTNNLLSEVSEIKPEEVSFETKHLRDTQKAVFELRSPLNSLLCIAESVDTDQMVDVTKVKHSDVILTNMSASIQDLQAALVQIESLSIKESTTSLYKYNTEIIETVMESVLKLRNSFEQLSTKSEEDSQVVKQALALIKSDLGEISVHIDSIEKKVGTFDVLQSDNKLEVLQKMAQILILLENNLPRLEVMPEVKTQVDVFHKNLTKVLENVIESNDAKKYFALMEVCDAVNRVNSSIKSVGADNILALASLNNTFKIIQEYFVKNIFEPELNCSILGNIGDILIGIQEAINRAEEVSMNIDSEHIQGMLLPAYKGAKAELILEHIEHTIAAISSIKSLETFKELNVCLTPVLETICPVLEELKHSVASAQPSGVEEEEHISELSEMSLAHTLASPICELNQNIVVLNQIIVENIDSIKDSSEILATIAEPLHELHTTLEVLQQEVISQYGENISNYDVSINIASAVQNLQSCILMIQQQYGVEAIDDMSTMEDISGIKTTADTIPSDRLVLPTAEETIAEIAIEHLSQELATSATAQALQSLNEHITVLQSPEIIDALDSLSEISDFSSLKSIALGLGELYAGIEEILHPVVMENSNELANLINTSKLTVIAEPMQELQQSLSVLDTSNIPIYEHILEIPAERIHSVLQTITEFKMQLDRCITAIFPAMETADKTVEISNKVEVLREVCEHLKDIIKTGKIVSNNAPVKQELVALEATVKSLLDATDVSKGIKIENVKLITEELYQNIITVQEEIIQFTPHIPAILSQEADLIQAMDEIESNIAVLEQYEFVDLSRASDITSCTSPQLAMELESESLLQMDDIVENAVNVVQDSTQDTPIVDLMIIEDFFKTCKNQFTILRCLMTKQLSHKKIIRILQEFSYLQSSINEFKLKRSKLNLSEDIDSYLTTFLIHAEDCLKNVQQSLIKIVQIQSDVLIKQPMKKLNDTKTVLNQLPKSKISPQIAELAKRFDDVIDAVKLCVNDAELAIIEELKDTSVASSNAQEKVLTNKMEEIADFVEELCEMQSLDDDSKRILAKVLSSIQKHEDYKDAIGTGKTLIILKCLSECSDVLQETLLETKTKEFVTEHKLEDSALKSVLIEMLEPLQAFHSQLISVQEQILTGADDDSISVDIPTTESLVQSMTEIYKEIQIVESENTIVGNEEISLIIEVDKEIHTIQDSIRSMENLPVAQIVKEISKPMDDIEKSLHSLLTSEKVLESKNMLPADVNSNIDSLESALERFINIEIDLHYASDILVDIDIIESIQIAVELKRLLTFTSEELSNSKVVKMKSEKVSSLKMILSKFNWLNTDKFFEGKNYLETEKLKHLFLTTYQLLAELNKESQKYPILDDKEDKAKELIQHIDQYIELIEIVEEISAITKVENMQETSALARELRESISATEFSLEYQDEKDKELKISQKQVDLAQRLQIAIFTFQNHVLEFAQEIAPALGECIMRQIAQVTFQLQAYLVAVTGAQVAIQAPAEFLAKVTESLSKLERRSQIDQLSPSPQAQVSEEIKLVAFEQEQIAKDQAMPSEAEKAVAVKEDVESTQKITVKGTEVLVQETKELTTETLTTELLIATAETDVVEQLLSKDDKLLDGTDNGLVIATTTEVTTEAEPSIYIEKPTGDLVKEKLSLIEESDVGKLELSKDTKVFDSLKQHIAEYISEDAMEAIDKISELTNTNILKQTAKVAQELLQNIAVFEVNLEEKAESYSSVIFQNQLKLAQHLQSAVSALHVVTIDSSSEFLPTVPENALLRVIAVVTQLQHDLNLLSEIDKVTSEEVVKEENYKITENDDSKVVIIEPLITAELSKSVKNQDLLEELKVDTSPIVFEPQVQAVVEVEPKAVQQDPELQKIQVKESLAAPQEVETTPATEVLQPSNIEVSKLWKISKEKEIEGEFCENTEALTDVTYESKKEFAVSATAEMTMDITQSEGKTAVDTASVKTDESLPLLEKEDDTNHAKLVDTQRVHTEQNIITDTIDVIVQVDKNETKEMLPKAKTDNTAVCEESTPFTIKQMEGEQNETFDLNKLSYISDEGSVTVKSEAVDVIQAADDLKIKETTLKTHDTVAIPTSIEVLHPFSVEQALLQDKVLLTTENDDMNELQRDSDEDLDTKIDFVTAEQQLEMLQDTKGKLCSVEVEKVRKMKQSLTEKQVTTEVLELTTTDEVLDTSNDLTADSHQIAAQLQVGNTNVATLKPSEELQRPETFRATLENTCQDEKSQELTEVANPEGKITPYEYLLPAADTHHTKNVDIMVITSEHCTGEFSETIPPITDAQNVISEEVQLVVGANLINIVSGELMHIEERLSANKMTNVAKDENISDETTDISNEKDNKLNTTVKAICVENYALQADPQGDDVVPDIINTEKSISEIVKMCNEDKQSESFISESKKDTQNDSFQNIDGQTFEKVQFVSSVEDIPLVNLSKEVVMHVPALNTDTLLQHIEEYLSADVVDVIDNLLNDAYQAEEIKQSVKLAQKLHNSITSSVVGIEKQETSLKSEQLLLAQQMQNAILHLEVLVLDSIQTFASEIKQEKLHELGKIVSHLKDDFYKIAQIAICTEAVALIQYANNAETCQSKPLQEIDNTQLETVTITNATVRLNEVNIPDIKQDKLITVSLEKIEDNVRFDNMEGAKFVSNEVAKQIDGISAESRGFRSITDDSAVDVPKKYKYLVSDKKVSINLPSNSGIELFSMEKIAFAPDIENEKLYMTKNELVSLEEIISSAVDVVDKIIIESETAVATELDNRNTTDEIEQAYIKNMTFEDIGVILKINNEETNEISDHLSEFNIQNNTTEPSECNELNTNAIRKSHSLGKFSNCESKINQEQIKSINNVTKANDGLTDEVMLCESPIKPQSADLKENALIKSTSIDRSVESKPIQEEHADFIQHMDEFISHKISNLLEELPQFVNAEQLKESISMAKELRESIATVDTLVSSEDAIHIADEFRGEQAKLALKLQNSLSSLQTQVFDSAQDIEFAVNAESYQLVSNVITHLQDDLKTAFVSCISEDIKTLPDLVQDSQENSMNQLEILLKEVNNKINVPEMEKSLKDSEVLRDTLDEVQTVIIKLKRDCDVAGNDTLNETLEDLECSVRSVQLQINEDSPPVLLKEACATLQLLANNMSEIQNIHNTKTLPKIVTTKNVMEKCSIEAEETMKLLEVASKLEAEGQSQLKNIVSCLNTLKDILKSLRLNFLGDAQMLIEKGIEVMQSLDQIEENVFSLEKDVESESNLTLPIKENILSAVHSVYGSISNMRSTISSIQKQYMHENYGKPAESILRSIKKLSGVTMVDEDPRISKLDWKKLTKSLRNLLNHFEDIKFYVNLDKTARLPSDAAFTKIILQELKASIGEVILPYTETLGPEVTVIAQEVLQSVHLTLTSIEPRTTLEVKEKIPVFKQIASQMLNLSDCIKHELETKISKKQKQEFQIVGKEENEGVLKVALVKDVVDEMLLSKAIQEIEPTPSTSKDIPLNVEKDEKDLVSTEKSTEEQKDKPIKKRDSKKKREEERRKQDEQARFNEEIDEAAKAKKDSAEITDELALSKKEKEVDENTKNDVKETSNATQKSNDILDERQLRIKKEKEETETAKNKVENISIQKLKEEDTQKTQKFEEEFDVSSKLKEDGAKAIEENKSVEKAYKIAEDFKVKEQRVETQHLEIAQVSEIKDEMDEIPTKNEDQVETCKGDIDFKNLADEDHKTGLQKQEQGETLKKNIVEPKQETVKEEAKEVHKEIEAKKLQKEQVCVMKERVKSIEEEAEKVKKELEAKELDREQPRLKKEESEKIQKENEQAKKVKTDEKDSFETKKQSKENEKLIQENEAKKLIEEQASITKDQTKPEEIKKEEEKKIRKSEGVRVDKDELEKTKDEKERAEKVITKEDDTLKIKKQKEENEIFIQENEARKLEMELITTAKDQVGVENIRKKDEEDEKETKGIEAEKRREEARGVKEHEEVKNLDEADKLKKELELENMQACLKQEETEKRNKGKKETEKLKREEDEAQKLNNERQESELLKIELGARKLEEQSSLKKDQLEAVKAIKENEDDERAKKEPEAMQLEEEQNRVKIEDVEQGNEQAKNAYVIDDKVKNLEEEQVCLTKEEGVMARKEKQSNERTINELEVLIIEEKCARVEKEQEEATEIKEDITPKQKKDEVERVKKELDVRKLEEEQTRLKKEESEIGNKRSEKVEKAGEEEDKLIKEEHEDKKLEEVQAFMKKEQVETEKERNDKVDAEKAKKEPEATKVNEEHARLERVQEEVKKLKNSEKAIKEKEGTEYMNKELEIKKPVEKLAYFTKEESEKANKEKEQTNLVKSGEKQAMKEKQQPEFIKQKELEAEKLEEEQKCIKKEEEKAELARKEKKEADRVKKEMEARKLEEERSYARKEAEKKNEEKELDEKAKIEETKAKAIKEEKEEAEHIIKELETEKLKDEQAQINKEKVEAKKAIKENEESESAKKELEAIKLKDQARIKEEEDKAKEVNKLAQMVKTKEDRADKVKAEKEEAKKIKEGLEAKKLVEEQEKELAEKAKIEETKAKAIKKEKEEAEHIIKELETEKLKDEQAQVNKEKVEAKKAIKENEESERAKKELEAIKLREDQARIKEEEDKAKEVNKLAQMVKTKEDRADKVKAEKEEAKRIKEGLETKKLVEEQEKEEKELAEKAKIEETKAKAIKEEKEEAEHIIKELETEKLKDEQAQVNKEKVEVKKAIKENEESERAKKELEAIKLREDQARIKEKEDKAKEVNKLEQMVKTKEDKADKVKAEKEEAKRIKEGLEAKKLEEEQARIRKEEVDAEMASKEKEEAEKVKKEPDITKLDEAGVSKKAQAKKKDKAMTEIEEAERIKIELKDNKDKVENASREKDTAKNEFEAKKLEEEQSRIEKKKVEAKGTKNEKEEGEREKIIVDEVKKGIEKSEQTEKKIKVKKLDEEQVEKLEAEEAFQQIAEKVKNEIEESDLTKKEVKKIEEEPSRVKKEKVKAEEERKEKEEAEIKAVVAKTEKEKDERIIKKSEIENFEVEQARVNKQESKVKKERKLKEEVESEKKEIKAKKLQEEQICDKKEQEEVKEINEAKKAKEEAEKFQKDLAQEQARITIKESDKALKEKEIEEDEAMKAKKEEEENAKLINIERDRLMKEQEEVEQFKIHKENNITAKGEKEEADRNKKHKEVSMDRDASETAKKVKEKTEGLHIELKTKEIGEEKDVTKNNKKEKDKLKKDFEIRKQRDRAQVESEKILKKLENERSKAGETNVQATMMEKERRDELCIKKQNGDGIVSNLEQRSRDEHHTIVDKLKVSRHENAKSEIQRREPLYDSRPKSIERHTDVRDDYDYTTSRRKYEGKDKTRFIDHSHRDYTMEFARPSGYQEKSFDDTSQMDRESYGSISPSFNKAKTIILDSQLRSSLPPLPDVSRTSEFERLRSDVRHRSKGISEARSTISEKRSSMPRDIKRKPVFSTYLTDRTAVEGSRVKLTCSVLSSGDPTITWYRNGVILDNKLKYRTQFLDGLITLEVLNAVPGDSAEYSCTVENENGSVNSSANLKVYPSFVSSPIPPTFTRSIRDTYHLAENELVLECRIRGHPLPTITWMKDNRPVTANDRYQAYYLADGVCRLAISHPTPEDSGKYTCKAENSVWSDQITHVVNYTGKESRLSPNLATIERSRFNRAAMESRRPHFTNVLSDYKVAKGGTIGLQVEIRGCPTRVEWLREGLSVTEVYRNARTFVEQELYTFALTDVTEKESGMYTCRAWSSHGTVDMNAAISVVQPNELEGKPAIIAGRPEKDVLISVGEDLNISFRVQGEPKPKVIFMKGIRDITNSQRVCKMTSDDYVKFTVKRSVISDAGTYCILARNPYGCDRAFVTVVVRQRASSENLISDWTYPADDSVLSMADRQYKSVPESIPGEPSVVDGGNNWVSIAWPKPENRVAAPVLAYRVESWLLGKEGGARWVELGITPLNSFDVFNLKQGEEYHFRVTPRNRYGWGESVQTSSPIGVGLAGDRPEFVDILPGQFKVLLGETASLSCSVNGKPTPEVVWMKNGHEIDEEARMKTSFNGYNCCLTIKDISIEDEARYSCEAKNTHGRASTYARLAVVTDRMIWEADVKLKRERSAEVEGEYPPQFTMRLRDRRVQATYPVRLTCQVVGSPPPTLTWFKDGEQLALDSRHTSSQDEHFHTLEIAPTNLEDGGLYEALARNSSGAVSCRCCLVVDKGIRAYVAPEFCCGLEPLYRLSEGEELRITAVIEAYPSVGVTWYRDGVRLRPSRRTIMTLDRDGQIELAIASVTPRDSGVYTCTASNEVGRASTSGKVDVVGDGLVEKKKTPPMVLSPDVPYSKEPMFIRKPRSSEAREGDTVIIACEVIGDPKPDVYWLRDFLKPDYYRDATHFKRVGAGPEYRFEIPHAKLDYTGAYSVVARNVHGEAKAIISLQILARDPSSTEEHNIRYGRVDVIPRFEKNLTDLLCYDGDAIEFECRVSGHPEPYVRWFHYTEIIRDCSDFETTFEDGTARLKIKQVTAEDEGTYACEASNTLGKACCTACLVVYPPGEPNTLSQRLRRPPALLSAASTPRSTPRSTPARSVSRTPGPDPRRLCSPSRQMAPKFYTYPYNKVAEEGDHVVIQCAVRGLPVPWTTWDKDGVILSPTSRITIREKDDMLRILEIEGVTVEDVGLYRITLENDYGRVEACARLEVITHEGKFHAGVRSYSASPRRAVRRAPSAPRQD